MDMVNLYPKITIIKIRKPARNELNEELQWVGASLGLFNLRDKEDTPQSKEREEAKF